MCSIGQLFQDAIEVHPFLSGVQSLPLGLALVFAVYGYAGC